MNLLFFCVCVYLAVKFTVNLDVKCAILATDVICFFVYYLTYTYMRLKNSPLPIMLTYSVMYIYSSLSLSISPPIA